GELEFEIEAKTYSALHRLAPTLQKVSGERIFQELQKLLRAPGVRGALGLLWDSGLLTFIFQEPYREIAARFSIEALNRAGFQQGEKLQIASAWALFCTSFEDHAIEAVSALAKSLPFPKEVLRGVQFCLQGLEQIFDSKLRLGVKLQLLGHPSYG